jgi:glycosyltransferase involved in cell wall biosynthesis
MTITFVLPRAANIPMGGFRIVYEYANRLRERGHAIHVIHLLESDPSQTTWTSLKSWILNRLWYWELRGTYKPTWFPLDPGISLSATLTKRDDKAPDADVIVATAWQTAAWVAELPSSKGRKFYFLQSVESLFQPNHATAAAATWFLPLRKIAIADWIIDSLRSAGCSDPIHKIPNGYDFEEFGIDIPLADRNPDRLMTLYHPDPKKGFADALAAVALARQTLPNLRLTAFGATEAPPDLPNWVDYHRAPERKQLRRLYNEASIFLAASYLEGWALPPCEATLSGAALVASDIGGYAELAQNERTALIYPVGNVVVMASQIIRLHQSAELRQGLNRSGVERLRGYPWESSVSMMEAILRADSSS